MSTMEERMRILRMVENGQVTAEEGAKLLAALDEATAKGGYEFGSEGEPKWFRVRVTDMETGENKVNVNIPLGLVDVGVRMGAKFSPNMSDVNAEEILRAIQEGTRGKIIDVDDIEGGKHIEVFVE